MNFIANESRQKLRGGYYTPFEIAFFLTKIVSKNNAKILEPSCGDGVFLRSLNEAHNIFDLSIDGIEIDKEEFHKCKTFLSSVNQSGWNVHHDDFLKWYFDHPKKEGYYDYVLGNPPFIRYQYLSESDQELSEKIFNIHGLKFTKHTNSWVPFIIASLSMLKPGGILGMVIPSEILNVIHANSLREHLSEECSKILILDPHEIWFEDTLQGAAILLVQKKSIKSETSYISVTRVYGNGFLSKSPIDMLNEASYVKTSSIRGKWTRILLPLSVNQYLTELEDSDIFIKFNTVAKVDVGIVTGANSFFLVPDAVVKEYKLERYVHPMYGRSEHCPGIIYDDKQHQTNVLKGLPTNFVYFDKELSKSAMQYIESGESMDLHTRYKCRTRSPWYKVPSVYSTEIGMLKRSNGFPRLILNQLGAMTTDTAYRIRTSTNSKSFVSSFLNPVTAICAEIEGRFYGGGVLELVPSEIERVLVPNPLYTSEFGDSLKNIDLLARKSNYNHIFEMFLKAFKPIKSKSHQNRMKELVEALHHLQSRRQRKLLDDEGV